LSFEISDLYQDVILDHFRNPRGKGRIDHPTHFATAHNPLCGDEVSVTAKINDTIIEELKHESSGCALCVASASMMVESQEGRSIDSFRIGADEFISLLRGESDEIGGKLIAFAGVSKFPMRVKCATLAWHTLERALLKNE
jgi:nitrogen fixation NifU-like protein